MKRILITFSAAALLLILVFILMFKPQHADVVIIGGGAAGMTAAVEASRAGADVVLLEKMNYLGGNTLRATGGMNAAGSRFQKDAGINDEAELFFKDTMESGHWRNNEKLVRLLVAHSADNIDWLSRIGVDLSEVGRLAGHSKSRTHRPRGGAPVGRSLVPVLTAELKSSGVDVRTENRAVALLHRRLSSAGGKGRGVYGVEAETREGRRYRIRCRSVIIATGGFGASPELYVKMNPGLQGFKTTNHPGAVGDYLYLTADLDAALVDMGYIQTHPTVEPEKGVLITEAVRGNGGILVNSEGERFTDELAFRDVLSRDILAQKGRSAFLVFDSAIRASLSATDTYFSLNLISKADSLDSLAGELDINRSGLSDAVGRYNRMQSDGLDTDYGRNNLPLRIEKPPYYGIRVAPAVHHCMGGLVINSSAEVLSAGGSPISGLYAAGEASGGIHAANRLGGNSLIDAVTFGRIAGRSAAERAGHSIKE